MKQTVPLLKSTLFGAILSLFFPLQLLVQTTHLVFISHSYCALHSSIEEFEANESAEKHDFTQVKALEQEGSHSHLDCEYATTINRKDILSSANSFTLHDYVLGSPQKIENPFQQLDSAIALILLSPKNSPPVFS